MRIELLLLVALTACETVRPTVKPWQVEISAACVTKATAFALECAKNANPMSDEEGEDLVEGCMDAADRLFGTPKPYVFAPGGSTYECTVDEPMCLAPLKTWEEEGAKRCR